MFPPIITISFDSSKPTAQAIRRFDRLDCFMGKPSEPKKGLSVDKSVSKTSIMSVEAVATSPPNI